MQRAALREKKSSTVKKDVCLRNDNSALTHGAEMWQMLAIPQHSATFLVFESCPNCYNGGRKRKQ